MSKHLPAYISPDQIIYGLLALLGALAICLLIQHAKLRIRRAQLVQYGEQQEILKTLQAQLDALQHGMDQLKEGVVCPESQCRRASGPNGDTSRTISFPRVPVWRTQ